MHLLSTKLLSPEFRECLIQNSFSVVEQPFIEIIPLEVQPHSVGNHIIFTSQNAVQLAFENQKLKVLLNGKNFYCVGEKTALLLIKSGQKVIKIAKNASKLVHFLSESPEIESFTFFCGKRRMPDIEQHFQQKKKALTVYEIYDTIMKPKKIDFSFDGILFFSPSAVEGFFMKNDLNPNLHCFCIGSSTAWELAKHTSNYSVANQPDERHLLMSLRQYFKKDHV